MTATAILPVWDFSLVVGMLGEDARKAFSLYVREGSKGFLNNDSNSNLARLGL